MSLSPNPLYVGLGQAARVGANLLASLIVGGGLGWGADAFVLSSEPWGMVTGLIFGLVAGVRGVYLSAQRWP